MPIQLESKDLVNSQQMEVAVNGPDGANHLIFCTGVAKIDSVAHHTYTFLVGPQLSRRQFVGAIASGGFTTIQTYKKSPDKRNADGELEANLVLIHANYDVKSGQVKVSAEVSASLTITRLAISYNVSILAELPIP